MTMLPPLDKTFTIRSTGETWIVTSPGAEPRTVPDPLADTSLTGLLRELREWTVRPVLRGDAQAPSLEGFLQRLARKISERLTPALLSDADRRALADGLASRPFRLTVRVEGPGPLADPVLALPWELISVEPGVFPVREGRLDVIREAAMEGAPDLPEPVGPFTVAALIAAPEDRSALSSEEEAFRLQAALSGLGQRVAFADLGGVDDLVELVDGCGASAIHFSGGGQGGRLLFENGLGFAEEVEIAEMVRRLRTVLLAPRHPGSFPRLFFLSSRGAGPGAPSTAPTLHRAGVRQVVGWFGPEDGDLCTRTEESFYRSLATGGTVLAAVREARAALAGPVGEAGERQYPLGWAQLALYHRGPDTPLSLPGEPAPPPRFRRRTVEISGLPVLEQGFIGRRGLQHEVRRRVHAGQRLLVFQGLGGLGKTALASQLVSRVFAPEAADQLILRCAELDEASDPVAELRAQAEQHGRDHGFPWWDERARDLRERFPKPVQGFGEVLRALRRDRPNLVLYADNAESLQTGPITDDPEILGAWRPGIEPWWREMERLAEDGVLVLASTRYAWEGLDRRSHLGVGPLVPADSLRMIDSFPALQDLPPEVGTRLAERIGGHPRTIELLDRLIAQHKAELGLGREVADAWRELVEPVLSEQEEQIRADLLLERLWDRISATAREHARRLTVLRHPAPVFVIDRLGTARNELIRAGLLTRYRFGIMKPAGLEWLDRWGLHHLVRTRPRAVEEEISSIYRLAGEAYKEWAPQGIPPDFGEGIFFLHSVGEGDEAWPLIPPLHSWYFNEGRFRDAEELIQGCEKAGTSGDRLALALMLLAQTRWHGGLPSSELEGLLIRAMKHAEKSTTRGLILRERGGILLELGLLDSAEILLREAVAVLEADSEVPRLEWGLTLRELGRVIDRKGRYKEAEELYRRSLDVCEGDRSGNPMVKTVLGNLAHLLLIQGRPREAEDLARKLMATAEAALAPGSPPLGELLSVLASTLEAQGRFDEAEGALLRSLAILKDSFGVEHPQYASSLQRYALVLDRLGRFSEAEERLRQAIVLMEKSLPNESLNATVTMTFFAGVLARQGQPRQAEALLRRALETLRRILGEEHPEVGIALHGLGWTLMYQSRIAEAESVFRLSLDLAERILGPENPELANNLHGLACSLDQRRRHRDAEPLLRRAFTLLASSSYSPLHPLFGMISHALAGCLLGQGRSAEAATFLQQALSSAESLGDEHPTLCSTLCLLGRALEANGRPEEAEASLERALAVATKTLGPTGADAAYVLIALAPLQVVLGRPQAQETAHRALEALDAGLGPQHPVTKGARPVLEAILNGGPIPPLFY